MSNIVTTTYESILEGRDSYSLLLEHLGITQQIHRDNRIYQAYKLIEKFIPIYKDTQKRDLFLNKYNKNSEVTYALVEMLEMKHILSNLPKNIDHILKQKFIDLSRGTLSPVTETSSNNRPRNTHFELSLLSELISVGLDATMGEINPDIILKVHGRVYNIECKRLYQTTKLNKDFKDASNQIKEYLKTRDRNELGLVAISMQRLINSPEKVLALSTHTSAYKYVEQLMETCAFDNSIIWKNSNRLPGKRLPAIILCYSTVLYSDVEPYMSNLAFKTITNTRDNDENFDLVQNDLKLLLAKDFMSN